jgi:hypothetical protein
MSWPDPDLDEPSIAASLLQLVTDPDDTVRAPLRAQGDCELLTSLSVLWVDAAQRQLREGTI